MHANRLGPFGRIACLLGFLNLTAFLSADEIQKPVSRQDAGENAKKDSDSPPAADVRKAVRKELDRYRGARVKPEQRAAALKQLAALGDEGLAAAKELVDKQFQLAETTLRSIKKPSQLDATIEELRKTLAELRHDPNLSKDQLHNVGLPALDALSAAYQQRARSMASQSAKSARAAESLRQLTAVLELLQKQWAHDAPLPVNEYLQKARTMSSELSSPEEEQARAVLARNQAMAAQFPGDIRSGMDLLNAMRMTCGLRPLLYDAKLCAAAFGHSTDMQTRNFFAHESPVEGKKTPWDRARLAGTTASGENIYMGSSMSTDALKGWFLSPGHHKNMLAENAHRQGLGHQGKYWTQMFGEGEPEGAAKK